MMAAIRPRGGSRAEIDTLAAGGGVAVQQQDEQQHAVSGAATSQSATDGAGRSGERLESEASRAAPNQSQRDAPMVHEKVNKRLTGRTQPSKCAVSRSGTQFRHWQTQPDELTAVRSSRSARTRQHSQKSGVDRKRSRSFGSRKSRSSRKQGSRHGDPRLQALAKWEKTKTAAEGPIMAREAAAQNPQPMVKDFSVIDFQEESMLKPQSKPVRRHSARTTRPTSHDQKYPLGGRFRSVKEHSSSQQKRAGPRKPLQDVFRLDDVLIKPNSIAYC